MTATWQQVKQSPQFQSLSPADQETARQQYFDQVVAPQIENPEMVAVAKAQFDQQTLHPNTSFAGIARGLTLTPYVEPVTADNPDNYRSLPQQTSDAAFGVLHGLAQIPLGTEVLVGQIINSAAQMTGDNAFSRWTSKNAAHDLAAYRKMESDYQSGPNDTGANLGGIIGNVAPWMIGPASRGLNAIGKGAEKIVPNVISNPLTRKAASSSAQAATIAALSPVTGQGDYWDQKGKQVGLAALLGGAIPPAAATARGIWRLANLAYDAATGPNPSAEIARIVGNDPAVLAKLEAQYPQGYAPTVSGALAAGGNETAAGQQATIRAVAAERKARNLDGQPFNERDAQNMQWRLDQLQQLAGSDTQLEAAKAALTAATQPFIDANLKPAQIADRWGEALKALQNVTGGKDTMDAVNGARKVIQSVISGKQLDEGDAVRELQQLAASVPEKVGGGPSAAMQAFDAAQAAIDKNMHPVQLILDAIQKRINSGIGMNPTVGSALRDLHAQLANAADSRGMVSGDILDGARQNASRYLAKNAPNGYFSNQETAGIAPIKTAISDYLASRVPGYSDYLAAYAKGSQPITDMESVRGILGKVGLGGSNSAGNPAVSIEQIGALLRSNEKARYPMSAAVQQKVENVLATLQDRSAANASVGAAGSQTAANLQQMIGKSAAKYALSGGIGSLASGILGLPGGYEAGAALGALAKGAQSYLGQRRADALTKLLMNPQQAAQAIALQNQPAKLVRLLQQSPQGLALLNSPQLQVLLPALAGNARNP